MRALAVAALLVTGACQAPADASVLFELASFTNELPGLRAPGATLDVVDDQGEPVAVEVRPVDGPPQLVQSPLPMPCDAFGSCSVELRVRPGTVTFTLHVDAADRCDARAELVRLTSPPVKLTAYETTPVDLGEDVSFAFDDDDDGIVNVLELQTCGRFDVTDGASPAQACVDDDDPCCATAAGDVLEGRMVAFAGGQHLLANGGFFEIAPFALDATEVTWLQLERCVAAGGCLVDQAEHPARLAMLTQPPAEPVVGLTPAEASELCAHFGKRLPLDVEWDYAAAHRAADVNVRGRYPWDDDGAAVSCEDDFGGGVAANFSIPGTACPGVPRPVGTFTSSHVSRGAGGAVADLAGNVAEWTLVPGASAPDVVEVPAGHDAVVLRGGGARSPLALLENDLPVRVAFPSDGNVDAWRADVRRLATAAGFRCAVDVDDGTVAPPFTEEPSCGGPP